MALVVLTAATLGRLCFAEFVTWDDELTIFNNPHLNPPGEEIGWFWRNPWMELYVPVTYTVWGGLARLARLQTPDLSGATLNPWVFHTANVGVHLLSVLVVFAILRLLLRKVVAGKRAEWAAFAGAALFAIHPLQVETVAWASGMKDLLCGLFSLLAVWFYLQRAARRPKARGGHRSDLQAGLITRSRPSVMRSRFSPSRRPSSLRRLCWFSTLWCSGAVRRTSRAAFCHG